MSRFLADALDYAARGWSIVPIRHRGEHGKQSAVPWKRWQRERPDAEQLRRWFAGARLDGLAVILGEVSGGLVCRDYDQLAGYEQWAKDWPELAKTLPTVITARGRHVYFRNGTREIVHQGNGELRGAGYCLLPPSLHPTGATYRWDVPLPAGELPFIADPAAEGLVPFVTERQRDGETEDTDAISERERGHRIGHVAVSRFRSVDEAIAATLPESEGERNRRLFDFARVLQSMPEYEDAKPEQLRDVVRQWHQAALPIIGTKAFEETWFDFRYGWDRVKYPAGCEPMAQIFARALAAESPEAARRYELPAIRLLVSLCRELQRASGDRPFFLSCRTAARLVGIDRMKANRWLYVLTADGVLAEAEKGSPKTNKATRYRYIGDR